MDDESTGAPSRTTDDAAITVAEGRFMDYRAIAIRIVLTDGDGIVARHMAEIISGGALFVRNWVARSHIATIDEWDGRTAAVNPEPAGNFSLN